MVTDSAAMKDIMGREMEMAAKIEFRTIAASVNRIITIIVEVTERTTTISVVIVIIVREEILTNNAKEAIEAAGTHLTINKITIAIIADRKETTSRTRCSNTTATTIHRGAVITIGLSNRMATKVAITSKIVSKVMAVIVAGTVVDSSTTATVVEKTTAVIM